MDRGWVHDVVHATEELSVVVDINFREETFDIGGSEDDSSAHDVVLWFRVSNGGSCPAIAVSVPSGNPPNEQTATQAITPATGKQTIGIGIVQPASE